MPGIELFFDTSALFAGIISEKGAACALLALAEAGMVTISISMQVTEEMERTLARKAPTAIAHYRRLLKRANVRILPDPPPEAVSACQSRVTHLPDAAILAAARSCSAAYLVTHNTRHFTLTGEEQMTLPVGTPGDALQWLRNRLGVS